MPELDAMRLILMQRNRKDLHCNINLGACIAFILMAALFSPTLADADEREPLVVVLAGQSNMVSRGKLDESFAAQITTADGISYVWNAERHAITDFTQVHDGRDPWPKTPGNYTQGVGLNFAFNIRSRGIGREIILVPCAVSGSSVVEWLPAADRGYSGGPFERCVENTRVATAFGTLGAILYYQGERDARDDIRARMWEKMFKIFVDEFRAQTSVPAAPVLVAPIAELSEERRGDYPYWSEVKAAQYALTGQSIHIVDTEGLTLASDGLHLSRDAHRVLGSRFADVFCEVDDQC